MAEQRYIRLWAAPDMKEPSPFTVQVLEVVAGPTDLIPPFSCGWGCRAAHRCDPDPGYRAFLNSVHSWAYPASEQIDEDDGSILRLTHGTFRIEEWEGGQVVFQVLKQDEAFRSVHGIAFVLTASNDIVIRSDTGLGPGISGKVVWLRCGSRSEDMRVVKTTGLTRAQIATALRDWDKNWPGWQTPKVPSLADCCRDGSVETGGVFEFGEKPDAKAEGGAE